MVAFTLAGIDPIRPKRAGEHGLARVQASPRRRVGSGNAVATIRRNRVSIFGLPRPLRAFGRPGPRDFRWFVTEIDF
jgi:hypothetical protein